MQPDRTVASTADISSATAGRTPINIREVLLRYALVLVLLVFVAVLGLSNASFFTLSNFNVVLLQVSTNALLATGATYVILTGGIDLSVGSVVGMAGVAAAMVAQRTAYLGRSRPSAPVSWRVARSVCSTGFWSRSLGCRRSWRPSAR